MSSGRDQARATFWLLDAPDSLVAQSHREPDGTGIGWFDGTEPQISKQPIAAFGDTTFAREAKDISSRTFLAHIRFASTGSLLLRNTHPFEQRGRLFAHNGVIEDLPALEAELGQDMALVHGDTDSERFFALITREIDARGGDVGEGMAAACAWVAANLPLLAINCILAAPEGLWALRYPETHDLFVLEHEPGRRLEHSSSLGSRVRSEHGIGHPLVLLASERMDNEPAWQMLPAGELLHVGPQLGMNRRRILQGPPARQLTLADLSPRAAQSQARSAPAPGSP